MHVRSVASENLAGVTKYTNISVPASAALAQQHVSAPKADYINLSRVGTRRVTFNLHTRDGARGAGLASAQLRLVLKASVSRVSVLPRLEGFLNRNHR